MNKKFSELAYIYSQHVLSGRHLGTALLDVSRDTAIYVRDIMHASVSDEYTRTHVLEAFMPFVDLDRSKHMTPIRLQYLDLLLTHMGRDRVKMALEEALRDNLEDAFIEEG